MKQTHEHELSAEALAIVEEIVASYDDQRGRKAKGAKAAA